MNSTDTAPTLSLPIPLNTLRELLRAHGVESASVFGSFARGEQTADSDLDILVHYAPNASLFDHFDLRAELEAHAARTVDVVSDRALSRHLRPFVEKDRVKVL